MIYFFLAQQRHRQNNTRTDFPLTEILLLLLGKRLPFLLVVVMTHFYSGERKANYLTFTSRGVTPGNCQRQTVRQESQPSPHSLKFHICYDVTARKPESLAGWSDSHCGAGGNGILPSFFMLITQRYRKHPRDERTSCRRENKRKRVKSSRS